MGRWALNQFSIKLMKLRHKYWFANITIFIGVIIESLLAGYISWLFVLCVLPTIIIVGRYAYFDKCVICNKYVLENPLYEGSKIWLWTPWLPKKCTKCGNALD